MATYTPLSTDFKDDILASQNSKRKYTQVNNSDGTVSFQDSTAYSQVGSSYGARGNITRLIQERLNSLGFNCGKVDGIFGGGTRAAVIAFQRAHGLSADGIVGKNTWRALLGL